MKTSNALLGSNGIPLFITQKVGLKSKSPLILVLTKTEQWVAACKAFFLTRSIGIIQGISIHKIMLGPLSLFKLWLTLS
jgi:hypothetical protein